jgi:peroxiredoxin
MSELTPVVPDFVVKKMVYTTSGENKWVEMTKQQLFDGKRVVIFGLPGAFTPTCSGQQLPGYEMLYSNFREAGIDDVYCITVNDSFVCREWEIDQNLVNVKVIPDGSAEFTIKMGMDVRKDNLGFGVRSWRYAAIIDDGNVIQSFVEEGFQDNLEGDPYDVSTPENVLDNVKAYGWPSKYEGSYDANGSPVPLEEGKHIDLNFSETTDVKETFS